MNLNIHILTRNILTIANNIQQDVNYFRIEKLKDGQEVIKENSFITRYLLYPFYSNKYHIDRLNNLINKNVKLASELRREQFIEERTAETTDLFLAVQKYNQTVKASTEHKLIRHAALANRVQLDLIQNDKISELNPSKIIEIRDGEISRELENDKPKIIKERRFFSKHHVRRYPGDIIDHSKEGANIFASTQKERLLSVMGRFIEAVARIFGFKITTFQKYHYRKNNETDEQIYATRTSPLSLANEPTSFWLGHATLFLSVPLKSDKGTIASFNVITDPVEGDLNSILYPRQTKFALSLEETPAPHVYLLSHNHFDHYSRDAIKKIFAQQPIMIVPKGDGNRYSKLAKELGFDHTNILELDWWQKKEIKFEKNGEHFHMQITATPARHWSGQGPCQGHESTFLGYVIQGNEAGDIYFAGDTARLNDDHIKHLKDNFKIRWNFQPGGPDEVREYMKSTHQASVDGLWMHFKIMIQRIYEKGMSKEKFLVCAKELKTIFMHTMTYKLGNLHLSDTKESLENVLIALSNVELIHEKPPLKSYEKQVFDELCQLTNSLEFSNKERLSPNEMAQLLKDTVIVPKIGSRLGLETQKIDQLEKTYF